MTVRLYTLSGMRLANGCEVPLGCDLDRPYELPPPYRVHWSGYPVVHVCDPASSLVEPPRMKIVMVP